ncbi:hypothetical protein ACJ41O_012959 [Fusarium nematophilum]
MLIKSMSDGNTTPSKEPPPVEPKSEPPISARPSVRSEAPIPKATPVPVSSAPATSERMPGTHPTPPTISLAPSLRKGMPLVLRNESSTTANKRKSLPPRSEIQPKPTIKKPAQQAEPPPQTPRVNLNDPLLKKLVDTSFANVEPIPPRERLTNLVFKRVSSLDAGLGNSAFQTTDNDVVNDLCQATKEGNFDWIKYLIEDRGAVFIRWAGDKNSPMSKSPLHFTVETGRQDIVDLLLGRGANPNIADREGHSPFHYALQQVINDGASLDITRTLLDHGASLDIFIEPQPIVAAVSAGHFALTQLLLEKRSPVDYKNEKQENLVDIAVGLGRADLTTLLLEHNCGTKGGEYVDRSPLLVAVMNGREDLVKLLMNHDADRHDSDSGRLSPFSAAAWRMFEKNDGMAITQMVAWKFTQHAPDGCPLMMMAVAAGHIELAKLLIEWGNTCREEWDGTTPLDLALKKRDLEMASVLVQEGKVSVDTRTLGDKRMSPLLYAVRKNEIEMVSVLLKTEEEPTPGSHDLAPQTPLSAACCQSSPAIAKMLLDWGVYTNGRSTEPLSRLVHGPNNNEIWAESGEIPLSDYTPLHIAARVSPELTTLLLDAGADVTFHAMTMCPIHPCQRNESGKDGWEKVENITPLHLALGSSAEILIKTGKASVFAKDSLGRTPLFWAASRIVPRRVSDKVYAVETNLAYGSPVNLLDRSNYTPLTLTVSAETASWGRTAGPTITTRTPCSYMAQDTIRGFLLIILTLLNASANADGSVKGWKMNVRASYTGNFWALYDTMGLGQEIRALTSFLGTDVVGAKEEAED